MNPDALREFLLDASTKGYAISDGTFQRGKDHSYETRFAKGEYSLHDNWFGGEPFGGREVVFYQEKPIWMMVYYGSDSGKAEGLIPFLQKALSHPDKELPVRGSKELTHGDFVYKNTWKGDLVEFTGEEKIYFKEQEVYKAGYLGGLVDQRADQL